RISASDAIASEASLRERIAALAASLEAIGAERDRTRASLSTLPAELTALRERRATVDHEAAEAARRARESADAARGAEEDASRTRVALAEAQAARVETERAHLLREGDEIRLGDETKALSARAAELAALAGALVSDRAKGEGERVRLAHDLEAAREALAEAGRRHEAVTARAQAERSELQRIDGELALARGQAAALREAVAHAEEELAARGQGGGVAILPRGLRWLHERLTVPDRLGLAVRAALGDAVAYAPGPDTLADLDTARGVTVLVANDRADLPVPDGCTRLLDLLELDADVRPIAAGLLRNVFVATGSKAAAYRAASSLEGGLIVTLDGMSVSPGIIRLPDDGAIAGQQAMRRLRELSARLTAELAAAEGRLVGLARDHQGAGDGLTRVEAERRDAEAARAEREAETARLAAAEADARDTVRAGEARAAGASREQAELRERLERVGTELAAVSSARATAAVAFAEARQAEDAAVQAHGDTTARAEAARLDAATSEERRSSLVRLRDTLDEQVGATERRIADEEERVRALVDQGREATARLAAANTELEGIAVRTKEAIRSAELARERSLAAEGSRRESEQRLAKSRERLAELRGERAKLGVEEERASGALRLLEEQVRAELGLPDDEPLPDPESIEIDDEGSDQEKATALRDLQRLRRRLIALEPVNPLAATELAEIGERHSFLATQRADLERAIADLRSLADELATTIAEQFSTTFQAVDREFGVFFQRLFNGGQASLRTSETEGDEEPGIDIYARPPGKRIGSLQQLSGGERALTATALLLAILRVKPAPFCVLDEVDAALDERNVGRFTEALRELTDRTQFIVITHNRKTIEAADTLYGVSMDEGGSSKLISLKLAELDERAG
ncbi:MAG TPA: hypothetical protein VM070_05290, partial [Candidatus Saccharimonadales bacterium]|nr:hypothetical protein [Candidatus Saccharimonadales bacterium]